MTTDWRPPFAYVPGTTPRHPEDLFDWIKEDVSSTPLAKLHETKAWQFGLAFLEDGYFWESHEVLEAVWMACPHNSPERLMVQSVIQRANARLKQKMGQPRAEARLSRVADELEAEARGRASCTPASQILHYNA